MEESIPSRTALRVALRRAAHQLYDTKPLVFDDPFAVSLLGETYRKELQQTPQRADRLHSKALRAWLVARSRFAEDCLASAVGSGVTQYVLLGAGLDTFALRNPHSGVRVFEVDHPATQAWKRRLLTAGQLELPSNAVLVPVDFEQEQIAEKLAKAGFDRSAKTVFAWLGVVPYLTLTAFRTTLAFIRNSPQGSGVVFDYGQPRSALPPSEQLEHDSLASRVRAAGEPFQLFFTSTALRKELQGFEHIQDLGVDVLNNWYFADRTDLLLRGVAARLVYARV